MQHVPARTVVVVWQDPSSRRLLKVGTLTRYEDTFEFKYTSEAKESESFAPLADYPILEKTYMSRGIPPFFANRIMSSSRAGYAQYLGWMGLTSDEEDLPLEILVRSGGRRGTDTFHVLEEPSEHEDAYETNFFVSGIRHLDAEDIASGLTVGTELGVLPEPTNPVNKNALLLTVSGTAIGWVPDWLCEEIGLLLRDGWNLSVRVKKVNLEGPLHVCVLCNLQAQRKMTALAG